ncbi:MAG TPA: DUF2726 domain-containing protein [Anaerolineales bacterium]|nr:DUF2726 domain-containing protein [Anaerolineales bacterium]
MNEVLNSLWLFVQNNYMFVFLGVLLILTVLLSRSKKTPKYDLAWCKSHYDKRSGVLTPNELAYYRELAEVVGTRFAILSKVRLEDIFKAKKGRDYITARNKISSRHVDLLLCQPDTFVPVLGIEIDDRSHNQANRIKRDKFVNDLFESSSLLLLRVKARRTYSKEGIRDDIVSMLNDTISL